MMKDDIVKYLEKNTSKENCWVYWNSLYHAMVPVTDDDLDADFQISIETLIQEGVIRFQQISLGVLKFALESTVDSILNDKKLQNLEEMESEYIRILANGDYEEAEEYRIMIREAKLETTPSSIAELESQMEIHVSNEDYMKAAECRDKINMLNNGTRKN